MYAFSLIFSCLCLGQGSGHLELLILHNNDLRARMGENTNELGNSYGGFARISHIVKEARLAASQSRGPPVLYLYAGDTYTGPVWRNRLGTNLAVEFLNILRPDVAVSKITKTLQYNVLFVLIITSVITTSVKKCF